MKQIKFLAILFELVGPVQAQNTLNHIKGKFDWMAAEIVVHERLNILQFTDQ